MSEQDKAVISEGTVIHGTLRSQDLVPAFLAELKHVAPSAYDTLCARHPVPTYAQDDEDDPWWDTPSPLYLLDELFDELNEVVADRDPPMYFGAHPGDGSDFGYWRWEPEEHV